MKHYEAIERRFGFSPPVEYRAACDAAWLDLQSPDYLWTPEAEWLTPQQLLEFEWEEHQGSGFVPFAFTGGGDHWCWWPDQDRQAVVFCPHDCTSGEFDSPSFSGFLFRRILDFAQCFEEAEAPRVRSYLRTCLERQPPLFTAACEPVIVELSSARLIPHAEPGWAGLLAEEEVDRLAEVLLAFPRLGVEFEWMR